MLLFAIIFIYVGVVFGLYLSEKKITKLGAVIFPFTWAISKVVGFIRDLEKKKIPEVEVVKTRPSGDMAATSGDDNEQ